MSCIIIIIQGYIITILRKFNPTRVIQANLSEGFPVFLTQEGSNMKRKRIHRITDHFDWSKTGRCTTTACALVRHAVVTP